MEVPDSLSDIDDNVLDIRVTAIDPERQDLLAFTWQVDEYTEEYMLIKLDFANPLEVSAELGPRDWL